MSSAAGKAMYPHLAKDDAGRPQALSRVRASVSMSEALYGKAEPEPRERGKVPMTDENLSRVWCLRRVKSNQRR